MELVTVEWSEYIDHGSAFQQGALKYWSILPPKGYKFGRTEAGGDSPLTERSTDLTTDLPTYLPTYLPTHPPTCPLVMCTNHELEGSKNLAHFKTQNLTLYMCVSIKPCKGFVILHPSVCM